MLFSGAAPSVAALQSCELNALRAKKTVNHIGMRRRENLGNFDSDTDAISEFLS